MRNEEIGIKYKKIRINKNNYILIPIGYVEGYSIGEIFYSLTNYKIPVDKSVLDDEKILVDNVVKLCDLFDMYEYDNEEIVREYYYTEEKDKIVIVETKGDKIVRKKVNLDKLMEGSEREILERINNEISILLNEDSLEKILSIENIKEIKKELLILRAKIISFKEREEKDNITKIVTENGHVKEIVTSSKISPLVAASYERKNQIDSTNPDEEMEISLKGLEQYIKERVFGHDEEIRKIAKTLIMNYTAVGEEKREPILLVGPTGVGKTETMNAATEYLNIPYAEINTINLVPQGIKGESLEDNLFSLIAACNYDVSRAQNALIFFDEFDKLGSDNTDYKQAVKDILLKFIEGGVFTIDKPDGEYRFNTKYLNKVFAGRFKELFKKSNRLGFCQGKEVEQDIVTLLSDKNYYGKELITRIKHIYLYKDLDLVTKKRILLESKLSEYLQKRLRYKRQFGVDLIADDSYIEAVLAKLDSNNQSIRELNNLVSATLEEVEYELLTTSNRGKKLVLTGDIVDNNKKFNLM